MYSFVIIINYLSSFKYPKAFYEWLIVKGACCPCLKRDGLLLLGAVGAPKPQEML